MNPHFYKKLLLLFLGLVIGLNSFPVYGGIGDGESPVGDLYLDAVMPPKGVDYTLPKAITGDLRVLVLMIQFSNFNTITSYVNVYNKVVDVDNYIQEVSYGNARFVISQLGSWITLNRTREYYGADSGGQIDANFMDFITDSLLAADPYIDYTTVDYVFLVHAGNDQASSGDPNDLWSKASVGKWFFSLDGGVYLGWMILAETDPYGVFAHEFGHNIGLKDLYDYNGQVIYVGRWSLMASGAWLQPPSSIMSVEKDWMGWLTASQVTTVNLDQYGTFNITPLENTGPLLMVKIPVSSVYYIVEYRRTIKTDVALPGSGVIIAWVDETKSSGAGPIRVVDKNPSTATKNDAYFVAGDTYINIGDDFYVKVLSLTQNYATIFVQKGIPNLYVNDISYVNVDQSYSFTVKIANQGGPNPNPFRVALYVDGVLISEKTFSSIINRNSIATITFDNIPLSPGTHTVEVYVDSGNEVIESNEGDNRRSITITSAPNYILTRYVAKPNDRVDIGTNVSVMMFFTTSDGVTPFANSQVILNDTPYITNSSGWVSINVYKDRVGKVEFQVTDPVGSQNVVPSVIFDMVDLTLSPRRERFDVGSTAVIDVTGRYLYDGTAFQGSVQFNDSLSKNVIGRFGYTVVSINDTKYGLTRFLSNSVSVIFDMVVLNLSIDSRVNLGEQNPVSVSGFYKYDGRRFIGNVIYNQTFGKNSVGIYGYRVVGISDQLYGLTVFTASPERFNIIYDMVDITLSINRSRVDVGLSAPIDVQASYLFDGAPYDGSIILNQSLIQNLPGRYSYSVLAIGNDSYGITIFQSNVLDVIFDRIVVILNVSRDWINIGENASISINAFYEFDGTPFVGVITLNQSTIQYVPGRYVYGVAYITDQLYGLSVYEVRTVAVIFDAVEVIFTVENDRVDVGSTANISFTARYAYSKAPYPGVLALNDSLTKDVVGLYWYGVVLVTPDPNNITALYYDPVYVIFDRVIIEVKADNRVNVGEDALEGINAYYQFDGQPFVGEIFFNDSTVKNRVGIYSYSVVSIRDDLYGLTVYKADVITVVYDKVIINLYSLRERYDAGKPIELGIDAYYAYDGAPYDGIIVLNGSLIQNVSGIYSYGVLAISNDSFGITVFESNTVQVIVDRVIIQLSVADDRIDVGSSANITWVAYYEYDGTEFLGDIYLNDSVSKDIVGIYFYTVANISDPVYGLTSFSSNIVEVIFDRVVVVLSTSDDRIDVGSKADIDILAYYEYDGSPFNGGVVLSNPLVVDEVGLVEYRVIEIIDDGENGYGLTAFTSNTVEIVFDLVIIELHVVDNRIDVGSEAVFTYDAYYAYDGTPFLGNISLNDSLVKSLVGRYVYTVKEISDGLYGLSVFRNNVVEVIFDRVVIQLTPVENRVDVGSEAVIKIDAYYEYDGSLFHGDIILNESLSKEEVGRYFYTADSIIDPMYGLTVFKSNVVEIIFDRIVITLSVRNSIVPIGLNASIDVEGYYEYDMQPFNGRVYLNDSTYKSIPGRYIYTADSIEDSLYGLTIFMSNSVEVVFEKPILKVYIDSTSPFGSVIKVGVYLEANDSLIKSSIRINDDLLFDDDGDGYVTSFMPAFTPLEAIDVVGQVGNYTVEDMEVNYKDVLTESIGVDLNQIVRPYLGKSLYIHPLVLLIYLISIASAISLFIFRRKKEGIL